LVLEKGATPLGVQIQDHLRAAIRERRVAAGERLPSTRRLAQQLGISRGTIVDAYEQLVAEGYLKAGAGSGTQVAAIPVGASTPPLPDALAESTFPPRRPIDVDFEYGIPDLRSVPLTDWSWAVLEATRTLPTAELGDEVPAGSRHLREVVTAYHRRVRSGCAVVDDAVIVSGFRQGLTFVLAVLAQHGIQRIALEDPGPREHDVIARRAGLDAVPVLVDEHGIDVDRLRRSGARAVLVTPAHQCPTGVALGPSRRRELSSWADEVDGLIIEDDYDAEFRYDRHPVGSLQGLNPHRVIALGSVSKTLAPAIRLGWVLAPRRFVSGIVEEERLSSRGAPQLDQEALALLMETGRFDRHLRRMRETYRARRDVLATEAELAFGPGRLRGLAAGCHALLDLPDGTSERAVVSAAAIMGVRVNGLDSYRFLPGSTAPESEQFPPALVLGFGNVNEHQIIHGIRTLAEVLRDQTTVQSSGTPNRS